MASSSGKKSLTDVQGIPTSPQPLPLPGYTPNSSPIPIRSKAESRVIQHVSDTVLPPAYSADQNRPDIMMYTAVPAGAGVSSSSLVTRVMSPNEDNINTLQRMGEDTGGPMSCLTCGRYAQAVYVCGRCHVYGHAQCLRIQMIGGWGFCHQCQPWAAEQLKKFESDIQALEWRSSLTNQLQKWKQMATTTTGVFSSVGMAIGGTGAMLATGTTALLQGAVQGAIAAAPSSSTASPAIMPPTPTYDWKAQGPTTY